METIQIFGYFGALAIGLILGLMGSGGSLMAVPILTYLFHISPVTTTAYSLFVVGTSASVGTFRNFNKGLIDLRVALIFAIPAFIAVYLTRKFVLPAIPEALWATERFILTRDMGIMIFFASLMTLASISMIRKKGLPTEWDGPSRYNYPLIQFDLGLP